MSGGSGIRPPDTDAEQDPEYGAALVRYLRSNPDSPDAARVRALQAQASAPPPPRPTRPPAQSVWQRLSTPAPWEVNARAALVDLLRRASTPAPWEQVASGQLGALLQHLRSTAASPEPPRP